MTPPTVLVADDDRSIRTVLTQALGRSGYQVRSTGNAATLWRWVEDGEGDLVITDVVMPDENGLDLIPRIRKIRPDLRVVVMSAQSTLMTAVKATQRGAFEYLPKPFDLQELLSVVGRALAVPAQPSAGAPEPRDADERLPLIGRSPAMQEIYRTIARLTTADLTVMINGEFGHRQGAGGPRAARLRQAASGSVRRHQHGGHPARTDRERAVRPRARRVHRRHHALPGTLRAGQRRHAVPRRDRRHAAGGADTATARAAGGRVHLGGWPPADQGQCAHHRRHPPRPAQRDPSGAVPRGSLLPAERRADPPAAAARAGRGHPAARPSFPGAVRRTMGCRPRRSTRARWNSSSATHGPAMCARWRT